MSLDSLPTYAEQEVPDGPQKWLERKAIEMSEDDPEKEHHNHTHQSL